MYPSMVFETVLGFFIPECNKPNRRASRIFDFIEKSFVFSVLSQVNPANELARFFQNVGGTKDGMECIIFL